MPIEKKLAIGDGRLNKIYNVVVIQWAFIIDVDDQQWTVSIRKKK